VVIQKAGDEIPQLLLLLPKCVGIREGVGVVGVCVEAHDQEMLLLVRKIDYRLNEVSALKDNYPVLLQYQLWNGVNDR
jgi:hypothetical protein